MLRCPFNNFSKCDGSCPFSMPDFASCRIATALAAIEGQTRGAHAQLVTVNAHLADMRMAAGDGDEPQADGGGRGSRPTRPDECYVTRVNRAAAGTERSQPCLALSMNPQTAEAVLAAIGETVSYSFDARSGAIVLTPGTDRKLIKTGDYGRRYISIQSDGRRIADALGDHRHVYMAPTVTDCVAIFRPTGEVD